MSDETRDPKDWRHNWVRQPNPADPEQPIWVTQVRLKCANPDCGKEGVLVGIVKEEKAREGDSEVGIHLPYDWTIKWRKPNGWFQIATVPWGSSTQWIIEAIDKNGISASTAFDMVYNDLDKQWLKWVCGAECGLIVVVEMIKIATEIERMVQDDGNK